MEKTQNATSKNRIIGKAITQQHVWQQMDNIDQIGDSPEWKIATMFPMHKNKEAQTDSINSKTNEELSTPSDTNTHNNKQ